MPLLSTLFAMVSQCTKYEVSRFTRYEAVNGGAKCRKWGGLGLLGVTQGNVTIRDGIPARRRSPIQVLTGPDVR